MKSIISTEHRCYMCGSVHWLEEHHVFGGGLRKKSERYGLKVPLCHYCHNEPPEGVHFNRERALILKRVAQRAAMKVYGWTKQQFIEKFGGNYI
jgi:hypothetical protein